MENCNFINNYSNINHLFIIEHANIIKINNSIFEGMIFEKYEKKKIII